ILGVDPGKRRLRVEKDGMVLFAQDFSIAPGGKETIRARLETPAPEKQDGPPQHETATAPPSKQTIAARRETPIAEKANVSPQRGIVETTESGSRSTFEHSLMTPDLFDTFSCCSGQYSRWNQWLNADVIEAEGVKLWGGHTLTALWAPVTVGTAYSVSLESRLTKEEWFCSAHLLLGGPGYGNSLESSYCVLIDGKMAVLQREGVEQCRAPLQSPIPGGEWFRVDADVNAGHVLVRVNGMPVLDFTDREPLAGPLHAWIGFLGGYQETWYRNLRISGQGLSEGATREFLPPVTAAPLPNGPVIYEFPINRQALAKDWWLSTPEAVNVRDGSLDLRGFNAQSQLILNRPLRGNLAVEVEMEYPTHEALNFNLALWTADALPRELASRSGGWLVWLPNNHSVSTLQWHGGPDQFDWIWTSKSTILAKTPYHVPLLNRRYVVRMEAVGDQARVFLDGRLLLEGKRPADAAGKDLPFYAAIGQIYAPVLVHAVRVYQLTQTSFSTSNGRGERDPKGSLTGALKTSNPSIEERTSPAGANAVRDSDRQVAEWAIGIGGIASVVSGGRSLVIGKTADLPQEPVSIRVIDFRGNQQLRDEDLRRLQGLKDLGRLVLTDTRIGDEGLVHLKAIESLCSVHLHGTAATDRGLGCLAGLSRLEGLGLTHTAVTGSFLEHFQGHPALIVLELDSSQVNDGGMQWLKGLPNLDRLQISHTRVTDAGLAHLKSLGKLRSLHASDLRVTDAGLVSLKRLEQLENLELCVTQVTDAGLKHLAGLCNLKRLLLKDAPIADDGLRHLQTLVGLEYLSLVRTQVGDQGLAHLAAIPSLNRLELHGSRATSKGVAALRTALPKCDISGVGD
ncbi:MAG: DUF1080 domain-containing protein, partial [Rhodopirellula sp.]|nr:DUF1080 domain-containing protein [Rhodopirellula sp.]